MERVGDTAVDAQRHDEAIFHYTSALSLNLPSPQGILIKRGKACVARGSWKQAIDDANHVHQFSHFEVNLVEPSSSGNHPRPNITTGLRGQACSFTQGRRVRECDWYARGDAVENGAVT